MTYDPVASLYDWLEIFAAGNSMRKCRRAFLQETVGASEVLLLGEGTGRFLVDLWHVNPKASITYLDSSSHMHLLAKKRVQKYIPGEAKIKYIEADILKEFPLEGPFDLIVTNFFFDCFSPVSLEKIVKTVAAEAKPKALWLDSDFAQPDGGIRGMRAKIILKSLYLFFGWTAHLEAEFLTPPDEAMRQNGFVPLKKKKLEWGLMQSTIWQKDSSISSVGEASRFAFSGSTSPR